MSRLETQAKMNMVNRNMAGIVKNLEHSLNNLNLEQAGLAPFTHVMLQSRFMPDSSGLCGGQRHQTASHS